MVPPFEHTLGFNRIGRFYINLYMGRDFALTDPQAICGAKMIEEDDPASSRDDHILTLFGVNSGTGQVVYNVKLLNPKVFGRAGSGVGEFSHPHGIACNARGDVYVADTDNNRLVRLRYAATELGWVGVVDSGLGHPVDVALDSRGRVYVTDTDSSRIVVYDSTGHRVAVWTEELDRPTGIAVLDAGADFNDFGYDGAVVVDRDRSRVSRYTLSGTLDRRLDCRRIGLVEAGFAYCAFDRHGNVYLTDELNSQVHMFDPMLRYIVSYGREGTTEGRFTAPRGIAIWRRFGQVFVIEEDGGQYYWLGLDAYLVGFFPPEFDSRMPGTTIALYVTELADISISVTDSAGRVVRQLTPPHEQHPGEVLIAWDGRDNGGRLVPIGEYRILVTARPTYSRPRYILKKELVGTVRRVADS
jgi:DNA-binding beta-propeller fold protein YncE